MTTPTLLALPDEKVARRIARYINRHFLGNVAAAAAAMDCEYQKLWKAAGGDYRKMPPTDLLVQIAKYSKRPLEWWIGIGYAKDDDE